MLAERVKSHFISAGDVLRQHVTDDTEIGIAVKEFKTKGILAPDKLVSAAVQHALDNQIKNQMSHLSTNKGTGVGFLLDGFPRTLEQARRISPPFEKPNSTIINSLSETFPQHLCVHFAISIDVPDSICAKKILGRYECPDCGKSINTCDIKPDTDQGFNMPPMLPIPPCTVEMCSHKWTSRKDDTEEIVRRRLEEFHRETRPVISYYKSLNRLINFIPYDGINDVDHLESLILAKIRDG
jgi:adenylate kinase